MSLLNDIERPRKGFRLTRHLALLQVVLRKGRLLTFAEIRDAMRELAADQGLLLSDDYLAQLVIATTANIEPARILYPDVPAILLMNSNGRFGLQ